MICFWNTGQHGTDFTSLLWIWWRNLMMSRRQSRHLEVLRVDDLWDDTRGAHRGPQSKSSLGSFMMEKLVDIIKLVFIKFWLDGIICSRPWSSFNGLENFSRLCDQSATQLQNVTNTLISRFRSRGFSHSCLLHLLELPQVEPRQLKCATVELDFDLRHIDLKVKKKKRKERTCGFMSPEINI